MQVTPSAQLAPVLDPKNYGQYAIKIVDAVGREPDRMEEEKLGTRRKLAGIVSMAVGVSGIGAEFYFLTS